MRERLEFRRLLESGDISGAIEMATSSPGFCQGFWPVRIAPMVRQGSWPGMGRGTWPGNTGENTFWYPSMTVFRQETMDDWTSVLEKIKSKLAGLVSERKMV